MRLRHPALLLLLSFGLLTLITTLAQCTEEATEPAPQGQDPMARAPQQPVERVRLLISGSMQGRLEPCGCASGQLGGLPRRMQHVGEQRNYDLLLEGGNLVAGTNTLDVMKGTTALMVLFQGQHPYDALGVSTTDLELPIDPWFDYLSMAPVVSSDLESTAENWPGMPFVEKQVRDHVVRIASFTLKLPQQGEGEGVPFTILPPVAAWQRAMAGAEPATLRVLMIQGTDTETRAIVPTLDPAPDLVACFDQSYSEPAAQAELAGTVPIVYPGIRGRVMLDLTLARAADGPSLGYNPVPLPASKTIPGGGGDPDVKLQLLQHREEVAQAGILQLLAEQTPTANGAKYVGSQQCAGCHPTAFTHWQTTPHAHAWQTLVTAEADPKRYGWPVTKYPDCVACHVVGYGEVSGFVDARRTANLVDVGCERCHGAGGNHILNPAANKLGIIGGIAASQLCVQCHDFEQSPDFLYGTAWPKIEHRLEPHMKKK